MSDKFWDDDFLWEDDRTDIIEQLKRVYPDRKYANWVPLHVGKTGGEKRDYDQTGPLSDDWDLTLEQVHHQKVKRDREEIQQGGDDAEEKLNRILQEMQQQFALQRRAPKAAEAEQIMG
ncbi:hypothetical protein BDZ85DRAFT_262880 [Elsinoe ampelina]|uniref:Uncharacterized protein n=1 Tax=Elsinoe ampelina TaxID=302913 RepID=A0A6A6GBJ3_9PEZI|nr:hypothetical protein BDZ85DRAFT_262880 [Elsinoe ampelina]